jgi:aspartyl-tRNA(Asn)/glutamyl-tRNA(Gln) amidotransferase subunit A
LENQTEKYAASQTIYRNILIILFLLELNHPYDGEEVRVAVKDNITTNNGKTTCASKFLENYISPFSASVVSNLQLSAPIFLQGKTNMDEFGMGSHSTNSYFGPVRNIPPFSDFSAGGSSGGSAAIVAAGARNAALGTDTGGSVRLPAAYTGIFGFKPSYGLISRLGVVPYANSLDTVGILARTPKGIRKVFDIARRYKAGDPTCPEPAVQKRLSTSIHYHNFAEGKPTLESRLKKLRIGVPLEYNIEELEDTVRQAWTATLKKLEADGHEIVPVSLPSTKQALSAYYVIAAAEASSNLAKYDGIRYGTRGEEQKTTASTESPEFFDEETTLEASSTSESTPSGNSDVLYAPTRGANFGPEVQRRILLGAYTLSSTAMDNYFLQAQRVRRLVQNDFDRVFAMPNPLHDEKHFDLSDMPEILPEGVDFDKTGPKQVDVLIVPTAPTRPPKLEHVMDGSHGVEKELEGFMVDVLTVPASLAGLPACSVPIHVSIPRPHRLRAQGEAAETAKQDPLGEDLAESGQSYPEPVQLPPPHVGIQVIGQYWDDGLVLGVSSLLENLEMVGGENNRYLRQKFMMRQTLDAEHLKKAEEKSSEWLRMSRDVRKEKTLRKENNKKSREAQKERKAEEGGESKKGEKDKRGGNTKKAEESTKAGESKEGERTKEI